MDKESEESEESMHGDVVTVVTHEVHVDQEDEVHEEVIHEDVVGHDHDDTVPEL